MTPIVWREGFLVLDTIHSDMAIINYWPVADPVNTFPRYPVLKDALIVVVAMGIFLTLLRLLFDR